jgi:hypothetical protein
MFIQVSKNSVPPNFQDIIPSARVAEVYVDADCADLGFFAGF